MGDKSKRGRGLLGSLPRGKADFIARAKKDKKGATQKNPPTNKSPLALKEGGKV